RRSPLAMKCTVNRANLKPNAGTSVYIAVDLTPSAAVIAGRVRSISLAIDSSGSMDGEKIEQAKAAALALIKQLRPTDQIAIVSFSDTVTVQLPMTQVRNSGGGLWHHIVDARANLPQIFQDQAAQMAGTVVSNPELKVSIMPGSELADAYTVKPVLNRLPRPRFDGAAYAVPLRDLIAGEEQTLVFRIGVPSKPAGKATLIRFSLVEVMQDVEVNFTDDPRLSNAETNPYPRTLLSSAEATVLMQRAVQSRDATALQKAETIMRSMATDAGAATAIRANPTLSDVATTMRD